MTSLSSLTPVYKEDGQIAITTPLPLERNKQKLFKKSRRTRQRCMIMKSVFALVVLLHLCDGSTSDMGLNSEIIIRLKRLNTLFRSDKVVLPDLMRLPNMSKTPNLSSCVNRFVTNLKQVLDNVTVHRDNQHILHELLANLRSVKMGEQGHPECYTKLRGKEMKPFQSYINFFRKLNNLKKK